MLKVVLLMALAATSFSSEVLGRWSAPLGNGTNCSMDFLQIAELREGSVIQILRPGINTNIFFGQLLFPVGESTLSGNRKITTVEEDAISIIELVGETSAIIRRWDLSLTDDDQLHSRFIGLNYYEDCYYSRN